MSLFMVIMFGRDIVVDQLKVFNDTGRVNLLLEEYEKNLFQSGELLRSPKLQYTSTLTTFLWAKLKHKPLFSGGDIEEYLFGGWVGLLVECCNMLELCQSLCEWDCFGEVQCISQIQVPYLKQWFFNFCIHILPEIMLCSYLVLTSERSSCMTQGRI